MSPPYVLSLPDLTISLLVLLFYASTVLSARFDHFNLLPGETVPNENTPIVEAGPPNPRAAANRIMGQPDWRTCTYIRSQQIALPNQDPLLGPGSTRVISFRGPGSSRPPPANPPNPEIEPHLSVPKTWTSTSSEFKGDCVVSLVTITLAGEDNYDRATFRDVFEAQGAVRIASALLGWEGYGGAAEFGERNRLALFVYAKNSKFGKRFDKQLGCVRKGADDGDRNIQGFKACGLDPIPEGDEGEAEGGEGGAGFSSIEGSSSRQCSSAPLNGGAQEVLYGLKSAVVQVEERIVRFCQGFIWDIGIRTKGRTR
ncbi:MAG: hypothetical protein M1835_002503 [Candelina submexicana]|nr:MAG: hypothetical protein M1835_002503 [Candelina submexicana]